MIRLLVAFAIALTFPAGPSLAQHDAGKTQGGDAARDAGDRNSIDELHDRIDKANGIGEEDKEQLHKTLDTVKAETDKIQKATALVDQLQAAGLITNDPAEKKRIESEVRAQLDLIENARRTLDEIKQNLEAEIGASGDLTREQKDEALTVLRDFADKRITEAEAKTALNRTLGGSHVKSLGLILVLFILLVIIGASQG